MRNQIKHESPKVNKTRTNTKLKFNLCIFQCLLDVQMKKHVEKKHKEEIKPESKCDLCEYKTHSDESLIMHNKTKHDLSKGNSSGTNSKLKCDLCIYQC